MSTNEIGPCRLPPCEIPQDGGHRPACCVRCRRLVWQTGAKQARQRLQTGLGKGAGFSRAVKSFQISTALQPAEKCCGKRSMSRPLRVVPT